MKLQRQSQFTTAQIQQNLLPEAVIRGTTVVKNFINRNWLLSG